MGKLKVQGIINHMKIGTNNDDYLTFRIGTIRLEITPKRIRGHWISSNKDENLMQYMEDDSIVLKPHPIDSRKLLLNRNKTYHKIATKVSIININTDKCVEATTNTLKVQTSSIVTVMGAIATEFQLLNQCLQAIIWFLVATL